MITNEDNLLNKFTPGFKEKLKTSELINNIYHQLLCDVSPYAIIERLIDIIENQQNIVKKLIENQPIKYQVVSEEMYKTLQELSNQENG
jgi:hypothetical protein